MSETSRRVNEFFRTALRADVETIRSEILLSPAHIPIDTKYVVVKRFSIYFTSAKMT